MTGVYGSSGAASPPFLKTGSIAGAKQIFLVTSISSGGTTLTLPAAEADANYLVVNGMDNGAGGGQSTTGNPLNVSGKSTTGFTASTPGSSITTNYSILVIR